MSIYSGTEIDQSYAHGRSDGCQAGELDRADGRGLITSGLLEGTGLVLSALTRPSHAYALGWLRGYRESVRTLRNGRWGT